MTYECFFCEPIGMVQRCLRRFTSLEKECSISGYGYHNAWVPIDRIEEHEEKNVSGDLWPHDDQRWPKKCVCGYAFEEVDYWQVFYTEIYKSQKDGHEYLLRFMPTGAMWYADWMSSKGPDGHCLCVQTPVGTWMVDGPASDGKRWTRTGTPPNVTVTPSIGLGLTGGKWQYHGWLRDGKLVDA